MPNFIWPRVIRPSFIRRNFARLRVARLRRILPFGRRYARSPLVWAMVAAAVLTLVLVPSLGRFGIGLGTEEDASAAGPRVHPALHTANGKIVDARGREVVLTGINWFGLETGTFAPHGLWTRNWSQLLDQIAGSGFNTIRLPYSNQLFDPASKPTGIDFGQNPDLTGLTGPQIMDKIVDGATSRGMMVILDRHRPDAQAQSTLWYTDHVSEQRWISDWVMLAKRYRDNPLVIGADLHNEPHGNATWGDGNQSTDWRAAAERAGNAVLAANPNWLILVEGVESHQGNGYWWGGNLQGARQHPVRLTDQSKLVYSAHDYSPKVWQQSWFSDPTFPANLPALWDSMWGYLAADRQTPVLVGEFGGRSVGDDAEGVWQRSLMRYLKDRGISYTYWCWNPDSGDTGGVLADDWTSVHQDKLALLRTYQGPLAVARQSS